MADLVTDDRRKLIGASSHPEHALEHADLVSRQRKSVDLRAGEHDGLPVARGLAGRQKKLAGDAAQRRLQVGIQGDRSGASNAFPRFQAHRLDRVVGDQVER